MDSPQSVVSPLKTSSVSPVAASMKKNVVDSQNGSGDLTSDDCLGGLEIYIHQARDIHNICIYQKQDVYAKLCLTSDPEKTVSTKIINGGGRNPVFNEHMQLSVRKVDSSLKCEIWMLSRVRNYLEDQLLGFALVPVSEVLLNNGKLEKEFSLSSTDLFHSPAGFVQLSVSFIGEAPEVIPIPAPLPATSVETDTVVHDDSKSLSDDMDKIEFPDPKVANENHQMVEQYIAMPSSELDSPTSDSMISSGTKNEASTEVEVHHGENFVGYSKTDSPPSSMSTNEPSYTAVPDVSVESSDTAKDTKSVNGENVLPLPLPPKDISKEKLETENNGSVGMSSNTIVKPLVDVSIKPDPKLVQQDIVDMYMKSMQQFTESLAKMKLPMDFENGPPSSENSTSDLKSPSSKNSGSRVFYGSRAFF